MYLTLSLILCGYFFSFSELIISRHILFVPLSLSDCCLSLCLTPRIFFNICFSLCPFLFLAPNFLYYLSHISLTFFFLFLFITIFFVDCRASFIYRSLSAWHNRCYWDIASLFSLSLSTFCLSLSDILSVCLPHYFSAYLS